MKLKARTRPPATRLAAFVFALCLFPALAPPCGATARAQAKRPITKDGLVKAIKLNGFSTQELVEQIRQRGVAFKMTPSIESEMRAAGSRPEVIEAARQNYRPGGGGYTPAPAPVPAGGSPLSKNDVLSLLRKKTPAATVERSVESRGVNFQISPQDARDIKAAGGTNSLIGAITAGYVGASPPPVNTGRAPVPRGADYDDLTDQATYAIDANDYARASQLLQQAIAINPSLPRSYQLLGFTELYLRGDLASAERNMRAAIERGGSAAFRVFHDHANGSFKDTCSGSLFVTRTNVTFKADNGVDTFATLDTDINEIKTNKFVGRNPLGGLLGGIGELGAFHIKVKRLGENKNYNFAPRTKKKKESELIIALVQSYGGVPK